MDTVSLVEVSLRSDSFKKKWNERNAIVLGQVCIHRLEHLRVLGTVVGRHFHAGAQHWTEAATWCRAARRRSCPGFWARACRAARCRTTALRRATRRGRRF